MSLTGLHKFSQKNWLKNFTAVEGQNSLLFPTEKTSLRLYSNFLMSLKSWWPNNLIH